MSTVAMFSSASKTSRRPSLAVALLSFVASIALSPTAAAAATRPAGPPLPIAHPGAQSSLVVAGDGSFVVFWQTPEGGGENTVWLQRFAADDRPLGPPRMVGREAGSLFFGSNPPAVGTAADGSVVVAWSAPGGHVAHTIQARLFDAEGLPRGPAFRASGGHHSLGPRLAVAPDGSFVVGWTGMTGGRNPDAYARRFAPDGAALGQHFLLHADTDRDQILRGLALAPDGRLAAVIDSWEGEGLFFEVELSLFAADDTPELLELRVNTDPEVDGASQSESSVVRLADGRWLVVFSGPARQGDSFFSRAVYGRLFTVGGQPLGEERVLPEVLSGEQREPVAAPLADGGFVVLWEEGCPQGGSLDCSLPESYRGGSFAGVYGRAFDAAGEPAGGDFVVPGTVEGSQSQPMIAAGPAGDVVATWTHRPLDSELADRSVWARRLAAPCEPGPGTLCLGNGRFRAEVEWSDFFGGSGRGIAEARDDLWGTFWFFDPENLELAVKLIDGRAVNGRWWIFFGALSNVEYTLRVTDTATGRVATYHNPSGTFASRGDTAAFADVEAATPEDPIDTGGDATAAARGPRGGPAARLRGERLLPVKAADRATSAAAEAATCQPAADRLCLAGGRFAVTIAWQDASGGSGPGQRLPLTGDTGAFWFFRDDNPEVVVKVLDARAVNGHFWVFYASLTNVAFELEVTDTATGEQRVYESSQGHFASRGDTAAFPVTPASASASTSTAGGRP